MLIRILLKPEYTTHHQISFAMMQFVFGVLALSSFLFVSAQLQICLDGGVGPCIGGTCPAANLKCINTTDGELCCDLSQISNGTTSTAATTAVISTTTTAACVDLINPKTGISDCPSRVQLCNNALYYNLMSQQCPKTCGLCGGNVTTPVISTCADLVNPRTGVTDCPSHASLCNHLSYKAFMRIQCPKTCGYCQ